MIQWLTPDSGFLFVCLFVCLLGSYARMGANQHSLIVVGRVHAKKTFEGFIVSQDNHFSFVVDTLERRQRDACQCVDLPKSPHALDFFGGRVGGGSAEPSRSLDRGRNTPKPVGNRSESVCAGLWAPPRTFLAWFRPVLGPISTIAGGVVYHCRGVFGSAEAGGLV